MWLFSLRWDTVILQCFHTKCTAEWVMDIQMSKMGSDYDYVSISWQYIWPTLEKVWTRTMWKRKHWCNVSSSQKWTEMIDSLFSKVQKTSAHVTLFFFITSVHFLYIIQRFTQYLHYKIRIIWSDSHLQDWTGGKKEELNVLIWFSLIKPSEFI